MKDSQTMNNTTTQSVFPFIIEGEEITSTLGLTPDEVASMLTAGDWNPAYAGTDPEEAARALIFDGPHVVVTQVATAKCEDGGLLAFAIAGTRANRRDWICITYRPAGWRKVTAAGFFKDRSGKLWMAGGYYDPTIQVLSVCG